MPLPLLAAVGALLIIAGGLSACGNDSGLGNEPVWKTAALGQTIELPGHTRGEVLAVTLVKVIDPAPDAAERWLPPTDEQADDMEMRAVACELHVRNVGTSPFAWSPDYDYVTLETEAGSATRNFWGFSPAGPARPEEYRPGESRSGSVVLEAYTDTSFSSAAERTRSGRVTSFELVVLGYEGLVGAMWTLPPTASVSDELQ